ncbi:hypothetical protein C5B86_15625 [Haloferax sp. Atlit-19N]|uniref:DUF7575 domain-containing protein n=1 Tax=Haloferax TaxID=2251 RepID=UPI00067908B4|nr:MULTISPECIES: hypothetical protein [Haloferax]RDZ42126.1 hypothetical protein C5B86_15625 [Haloferax sp. Atlit-19N]
MNQRTVKHPFLAALLSSFVAGLGQLSLRRWKRAFAWAVVLLGVGSLSGPDVVTTYLRGAGDFWSAAPLFVVTLLATIDAYVVARAQNRASRRSGSRDGRVCPNCRRTADPSLEFCEWCATELDSVPGSEAEADAAEGGLERD